MQKIILCSIIIVFSLVTKAVAQEDIKEKIEDRKEKIKERKATIKKDYTFEQQVKEISVGIEFARFIVKDQLKDSINVIFNKFNKGLITQEEYDNQKKIKAAELATILENKLKIHTEHLDSLIQRKINGELGTLHIKKDSINYKGKYHSTYAAVTDSSHIFDKVIRTFKNKKAEKSTTSQFVFAAGLNNVITDGEDLKDSDFKVWGSHFYEWGITFNSRIFKNHNLLHAKYGLSLMYNNLRATDNRLFVKTGNETYLQTASIDLDESRFRNVFLVAPVHLEFDFSGKKTDKEGNSYFKTHDSFRLGIGGYAGVRVKSKQILKYEENGNDVKVKEKGNFNVSDFTYGLSTYIGYKATSLYVKYDLNPMFKNNNIDQNNVSLGIRFDFN